jgi:DNA primase
MLRKAFRPDKTILAQIKAATDLRKLAEELEIKQYRHGWRCPFHDDHHPSLVINQRSFRCFACGANGDAFTFLGMLRGLRFPDALAYVAERAGIALPKKLARRSRRAGTGQIAPVRMQSRAGRPSEVEQPDESPTDTDLRIAIFTALARGARLLADSQNRRTAFDYLQRRGISAETAIRCGIGYIPCYQTTTDRLTAKIPLADLQACGLFNQKGNFRLFKHKLIFPYSCGGQVFGLQVRNIGWRSKELDGPKEITIGPISIPFNVDLLTEPQRDIYICEGPIDTASLIELGLPAVGVPGARNFLPEWVPLFEDVENIIVAFDMDEAGQKGAAEVVGHFARAGRDVQVLQLPPGVKDINDFLLAEEEGGHK